MLADYHQIEFDTRLYLTWQQTLLAQTATPATPGALPHADPHHP
jgi:hypothetical protein